MHPELALNGGFASNNDVVSLVHEGGLWVGELVITVGVNSPSGRELFSVVNLWDEAQTDDPDPAFATFLVKDRPLRVQTCQIDTCLVYHMSAGKKTCVVQIPYDRRRV